MLLGRNLSVVSVETVFYVDSLPDTGDIYVILEFGGSDNGVSLVYLDSGRISVRILCGHMERTYRQSIDAGHGCARPLDVYC